MAYVGYKYLPRRTIPDRVLSHEPFAIASNPQYGDGYQLGLYSTIYKFFQKKSRDPTTHSRTGIISNDPNLANKIHKPITRQFKKRKIYSSFILHSLGCWSYRHAINKQL